MVLVIDEKERRWWWRSNDGNVSYEEGTSFKHDVDYFWFGEDEEDCTHCDDLFEDEESAKQDAIECCNEQIVRYQAKLRRLTGLLPSE